MQNIIGLICVLFLHAVQVGAEMDPERRGQWQRKWKPMNNWAMYKRGMAAAMYTAPNMNWKYMSHQRNMYSAYKPMTTWTAPTWKPMMAWQPKKWMAPMYQRTWKAMTWKGMTWNAMSWKGMTWNAMSWKGKGYAKGKNGMSWKGGKGGKGRSMKKSMKMSYKGKGKGKGKGVDPCNDCRAECIGVDQFFLIDADNDERLMPIMQGDRLDLGMLYQMFGAQTDYAIECVTFGQVVSTFLEEATIGLNNTDNDMPWSLSGDVNGDFMRTPFQENPGDWVVTCQPFCGVNATGETSGSSSIEFEFFIPSPTPSPTSAPSRAPTTGSPTRPPTESPTVTPTEPRPTPAPVTDSPTESPTTESPTETPLDCSNCQRGCIFVTGFALVDANAPGFPIDDYEDSILRTVEDGDVLDLSELRAEFGVQDFTIVCRTDPYEFGAQPFEIGSAGIRDNYASAGPMESEQMLGVTDPFDAGYWNEERTPPFSLGSDDQGDYNPTDFDANLGEWIVSCQAFCEERLGWGPDGESGGASAPGSEGSSSEEVEITFTVIA